MVDNHLEAQKMRLQNTEKVDAEEDVVSNAAKDITSTFAEISKNASDAFKSLHGKK